MTGYRNRLLGHLTFAMLTGLLLIGSLMTSTATAQLTTDFTPNFEVGQVAVYWHQAEIISSQEQLDSKKESQGVFESKNRTTLIMRVEVMSIDENGVATIQMTYDRIAISGESMFSGAYSFDSLNQPHEDASPSVGRAMRTLLDSTVTATVDPQGKVLSISGTEEAVELMQKAKKLAGSRSNEFQPAALTQMIQSFWTIGETPVMRSEGDHWEETQGMEVGGLGTLNFISSYDLIHVGQNIANIEYKMDMSLDLIEQETEEEPTEAVSGTPNDLMGPSEETDDQADHPKSGPWAGDQMDQNQSDTPPATDQNTQDAEQTDEPKNDGTPDEFQSQYIPIQESGLTVGDNPGYFIWDMQRGQLIERSTELSFELRYTQAGLFDIEITSITKNDVITTMRRIAVE